VISDVPWCAGVGPSSGSFSVLSAQNPPTWEMLHPSEMKGPVLPDTTVQRSPRLSKVLCCGLARGGTTSSCHDKLRTTARPQAQTAGNGS
jgi:hypothetical protein